MNRARAYCYRKSASINTNMYLESIHKTIKSFILKVEKVNVWITIFMLYKNLLAIKFFHSLWSRKKMNILRNQTALPEIIRWVKKFVAVKLKKILPYGKCKNVTYEVTHLKNSCSNKKCHLIVNSVKYTHVCICATVLIILWETIFANILMSWPNYFCLKLRIISLKMSPCKIWELYPSRMHF